MLNRTLGTVLSKRTSLFGFVELRKKFRALYMPGCQSITELPPQLSDMVLEEDRRGWFCGSKLLH